MDNWDFDDVASAIKSAGFDKDLIDYIFEKDLSNYELGDEVR